MGEHKDQIDVLHDIIADNTELAIHQAHMEGRLDAPLAGVIETMGRGEADLDPVRVAMVLNFVGRTLRDAYGRVAYREGLMLAQSDLYYEGSAHGMEQVVESAREGSEKMVAAVQEAMDGVLAELPKHLWKREMMGAVNGVLTGLVVSMAAFAWACYAGIVTLP